MHRAIPLAVALLALAACARTGRYPVTEPPMARASVSHGVFARLQTNDWLVSRQTEVWKVLEERRDMAPRHVGFVVGKDYRQEAGGATYRLYTVTTLDRRDAVGQVDQMGRAVRYEPVRGGGLESRDVGRGTLEENVAAIFATTARIHLERTTERRLAFEALDRDGSGRLEKADLERAGPRVAAGDRNRDGVVDAEEFDAVDVL